MERCRLQRSHRVVNTVAVTPTLHKQRSTRISTPRSSPYSCNTFDGIKPPSSAIPRLVCPSQPVIWRISDIFTGTIRRRYRSCVHHTIPSPSRGESGPYIMRRARRSQRLIAHGKIYVFAVGANSSIRWACPGKKCHHHHFILSIS